MNSLTVDLTVQNVRLFNVDGRRFIDIITVELFPKRKETGEVITNELVMSLKQFMHYAFVRPNFLQVFFAKCDQYYSLSNGEWYSLLLGATINVTIERYEDGDVFVNDISGEEESSNGISYHTRLNTINLGICGRKYAINRTEDLEAVEQTILQLQNTKAETFKFPAAE